MLLAEAVLALALLASVMSMAVLVLGKSIHEQSREISRKDAAMLANRYLAHWSPPEGQDSGSAVIDFEPGMLSHLPSGLPASATGAVFPAGALAQNPPAIPSLPQIPASPANRGTKSAFRFRLSWSWQPVTDPDAQAVAARGASNPSEQPPPTLVSIHCKLRQIQPKSRKAPLEWSELRPVHSSRKPFSSTPYSRS